MRGSRVGTFVGVVALAVAAFGIYVYEAWWTFAFVVFAVVAIALDRSRLGNTTAILVAGIIGGLVLLGGLGVFFILLGGFVGLALVLAGFAAFVVAIVGLALTVQYLRRRLRLDVEPGPDGIAPLT
jgi:hypothetical protein